MIQRPLYLQKLRLYRDKPVIKVVTGVRRCGKSTLFELFRSELLADGVPPECIQSLNMESLDNIGLLDCLKLYEYITNLLVPGVQNYVFLDEIQNVPDFQRTVRSLFDRGQVDLYLTGSNSHLQAGEWATSLTGRYVEISMLPFSFCEYLSAVGGASRGLDAVYRDYCAFGAFPYIAVAGESRRDVADDYIQGIYQTILLRDIVENKKIADVSRLQRVIRFLAGNIGSECSVKKIADTMSSDGVKMTSAAVENYLTAFRDSYLVYEAERYDVRGRQVLKTRSKYYLVDMGLRRYLMGQLTQDTGHLLENIVYLELRRRGYRVYVGKLSVPEPETRLRKTIEVDFVAIGAAGAEYYQVTESLTSGEVRSRELSPLLAIRDHYPKYVLTRDYTDETVEGIRCLNVLEWLAGE